MSSDPERFVASLDNESLSFIDSALEVAEVSLRVYESTFCKSFP